MQMYILTHTHTHVLLLHKMTYLNVKHRAHGRYKTTWNYLISLTNMILLSMIPNTTSIPCMQQLILYQTQYPSEKKQSHLVTVTFNN
jgi:hypothetical protein